MRVFISYASEDADQASQICAWLEKSQIGCWIAPRDIDPGGNYDEAIIDAIDSCLAMVLVLSACSNESVFVKHELERAVSQKKPIFPVRIENVFPSKKLAFLIGTRQWIDLWPPPVEEILNRLAAAVKRAANKASTLAPDLSMQLGSATMHLDSAVSAALQGTRSPAQRGSGEVELIHAPSEIHGGPMPALVTESGSNILVNSVDRIEYVWIPAGVFTMGAVKGDPYATDSEKPRHVVTLTKGLWMSAGPISVAAYTHFASATGRVMPTAPYFNEDWENRNHPMVRVAWQDAKAYCVWAGGRLPTEAEWEYAARGGILDEKYVGGDKWNGGSNKSEVTTPIGSFPPNGFGLFDMTGNVWEWVEDWFESGYYAVSPSSDPTGPERGSLRCARGGTWHGMISVLRLSNRGYFHEGCRFDAPGVLATAGIGFRCVLQGDRGD